MSQGFPSIGEYNQLMLQKGGSIFRTLHEMTLIPSRTSPIKYFLFGSGAYAVVFKGVYNGKTYAIRCFLTAESETINRCKTVCDYLKDIHSNWKAECELLENEIGINGVYYPVLKMEWIDGILINQFVTQNLSDNNVLSRLQQKLVAISNDLEAKQIGHGDLQCGNIIITGSNSNFDVRLIDYDGMFVPALNNKKSIEKGRSEFQHPKRVAGNVNSHIDRFSFWVIITALEALKFDKTLWREVMNGGFNTLDNFLFSIQDFLSPNQSRLFNILYKINAPSLNFYLDKLKWYCTNEISVVTKPEIFDQLSSSPDSVLTEQLSAIPGSKENSPIDRSVTNGKYKIITNNGSATVLTSAFKKIGTTPLELDKSGYVGKTLLISNGRDTRRISLDAQQSLIEIKFE
jgi:hypothetical protein